MDLKQKGVAETSSTSPQIMDDTARNFSVDQFFPQFNPLPYCPPRAATSKIPPLATQPQSFHHLCHEVNKQDKSEPASCFKGQSWDPRSMLNKLSFLEQKIHQVQGIVHSIAKHDGQFSVQANEVAAQQQLVTADLTCIIIQLISTAGTLLPSVKSSLLSANIAIEQLGIFTSSQQTRGLPSETMKASDFNELIKGLSDCGSVGDELIKCLKSAGAEVAETAPMEDNDLKDAEDVGDGENLTPGSYEVLQLEKEEILAPHTHFCVICGKGFKRDANLRMHMRGHGDEYKSPAALAKPVKELSSEQTPVRRYSCPFVGCKRNKEHKKFLPLKTILCVKNHYKRSHCDKRYTCSRCGSKKFSVLADLKTHEKHCGRDKWLCSCGTTFSRKDKLFGHVALFQGHSPALPTDDSKAGGASDHGFDMEEKGAVSGMVCNLGASSFDDAGALDAKGIDDDRSLFSLINFDSYNFGGLEEFPRPAFDVSDGPFCLGDGVGLSSGRLG